MDIPRFVGAVVVLVVLVAVMHVTSCQVLQIRKVIGPADIHYVRSSENPADPASRGLRPEALVNHETWFNGPHWLNMEHLPISPFADTQNSHAFAAPIQLETDNWIERFSCYHRLL